MKKTNDQLNIKNIGIVAKINNPGARDIIIELYNWLNKLGINTILEADTANLIGHSKGYEKSEIPPLVDILIVLGGDGTLISAARSVNHHNVPLIGINMGHLGFLTALTLDKMYPALKKILGGHFLKEDRMMLFVEIVRDDKVIYSNNVFNDAAVNKGKIARIIDLEIHINDQFANRYRSDGLILSTPSGSTAYSLSAGGPIVYPTMEAIILSPICPHTLTNRPIIVPADVVIEVTLTTQLRDIILTLDGQEVHNINYLDTIRVKKADHPISLIQFPNRNHYEVLNKKLHWGK